MISNRLPIELDILVASGDQALPTGDLNTTGTAYNIANGQIGVISYDNNSAVKKTGKYIVAGDDSAEVTAIRIVKGTPKSAATQTASIWEESDKAIEKSGIIRRGMVTEVAVKKASFGRWGGLSITGFPTPANDTLYDAYLNTDSTRIDRQYPMNDNTVYGFVGPINFTTAGITQPKDYVLQKLASNLNAYSRFIRRSGTGLTGNKQFVVLGVNIAGSPGVVINTITPTTSITVEVKNGVNQVIQLGEAGVVALAQLVHADPTLAGTSSIVTLNALTAGAAANVDALIVLGIPHSLTAVVDEVNQTFVTPTIQLASGFRTGVVPAVTTCNAAEPENSGRMWLNNWKQRAGLMVHTKQTQPMGDYFAEGVNYINPAKMYTSYSIGYQDVDPSLTITKQGNKQTIILLPCEKLSTFTVTVANVVTRIAAGNTPITMVTSNDAGGGVASVNTVAGLEAVLTAWLEHSRTTAGGFTVTGDAIPGGVYLS